MQSLVARQYYYILFLSHLNISFQLSISVGEFRLACDPSAELFNILLFNNIFRRNMSVLVYSGNSSNIFVRLSISVGDFNWLLTLQQNCLTFSSIIISLGETRVYQCIQGTHIKYIRLVEHICGRFQLAPDTLVELSNILSLNNIFGRNMSVLVYSGTLGPFKF